VAWAEELAKVERRRDTLIEMRPDGDITKEKLREKAAAESEKLLDSLPGLVEEYTREVSYLVAGREKVVRDHTYTDERKERKRSERCRELYAVLGLGVTVHKDGALDVMVESSDVVKGAKPGEEPSTIWECITGRGFDDSALLVGEFARNPKGGVMSCDGSS
jgi:hypothetical protein